MSRDATCRMFISVVVRVEYWPICSN